MRYKFEDYKYAIYMLSINSTKHSGKGKILFYKSSLENNYTPAIF